MTGMNTTELSDCGCCKGISAETPVALQNRPGLSAIAYRVGTHSTFRETLHARLSGSGQPALNGLTTRDNNDFSIALLDAWAMVGDVLTFYTERIANEAYLRTATERLSVLELARLINYELRPGVAAGTYLAFTIEDTPGAGGQALAVGTSAQIALEQLPPIVIGAGVKVQSIPGPGEQAQTFETTEAIEARPEWNAIKSRLTQPQTKSSFWSKSLFFEGTANDLKKGDHILLLTGGNTLPLPRKVIKVSTDDEAKTTRVDFDLPQAGLPAYQRPSGLPEGEVDEFQPRTTLSKEVTQQIIGEKWKEEDLAALISTQGWNANALTTNIKNEIAEQTKNAQPQAFVYREKAAVFGYNAPKKPVYKGNVPDDPENWAEWSLDPSEDEKLIYLDRAYEAITPGSYITVKKGKLAKTIQVVDVTTEPRTAYSISSKSTVLTLAESWWTILPDDIEFGRTDKKGKKQRRVTRRRRSTRDLGALRDVAVYAQSESLPLSQLPIDTPLQPNNVLANGVTLDGPYFGLKSGQRVIIKGEKDNLRGVYGSETLTLKTVEVEAGFTVVTFNESLAYPYVRKTVTINANVATATHGETVAETLGGGDATQAFQRFTLKQPPLTYISASTPTGAASTLRGTRQRCLMDRSSRLLRTWTRRTNLHHAARRQRQHDRDLRRWRYRRTTTDRTRKRKDEISQRHRTRRPRQSRSVDATDDAPVRRERCDQPTRRQWRCRSRTTRRSASQCAVNCLNARTHRLASGLRRLRAHVQRYRQSIRDVDVVRREARRVRYCRWSRWR